MEMTRPLDSLSAGRWFKLICGASYQHLPEIRNLALVFTLAGADCIDVAADPAVIRSARAGIDAALKLDLRTRDYLALNLPKSDCSTTERLGPTVSSSSLVSPSVSASPSILVAPPILMVSLNDGEDPHFRKASLNPNLCPQDCPQPCVSLCPAEAIRFDQNFAEHDFSENDLELANSALTNSKQAGVIPDRCYGCGRCLPVCPIQQIVTHTHIAHPQTIIPLITSGMVQAVEIHTQIGREQAFANLWQVLAPYQAHLKVLAVSCGDGEGLIPYLSNLYEQLHTPLNPLTCPLIWQTDGRPMSGDIGDGATRATIKLGQKVLAANLPGYVQLAGGTNNHTVPKLRHLGLLRPPSVSLPSDSWRDSASPSPSPATTRYITGVAYGSFARSQFADIQEALAAQSISHLEDHVELLNQALHTAQTMIAPLKRAVP
jgi:Fe-S-cluster-containing hydrogenase component 2